MIASLEFPQILITATTFNMSSDPTNYKIIIMFFGSISVSKLVHWELRKTKAIID